MRDGECPSYSCSAGQAAGRVRTYQCSTIEYDSGLPASCVQVPELFLKKMSFMRAQACEDFVRGPQNLSVTQPPQNSARHKFREHGHGSTSTRPGVVALV